MKLKNQTQKNNKQFFDSNFNESEQIPRNFTAYFNSIIIDGDTKTRILINEVQVGDIINDNSIEEDFYRFHDVFHYTFAAMLGWSPCTRAMMKRKRKSNPKIDEVEDGARAIITEEAIALIIFNKAKKSDFFKYKNDISSDLLDLITELTTSFEVSVKSKKEWEEAIQKGYSVFRELIKNNGGKVHFDMLKKSVTYEG